MNRQFIFFLRRWPVESLSETCKQQLIQNLLWEFSNELEDCGKPAVEFVNRQFNHQKGGYSSADEADIVILYSDPIPPVSNVGQKNEALSRRLSEQYAKILPNHLGFNGKVSVVYRSGAAGYSLKKKQTNDNISGDSTKAKSPDGDQNYLQEIHELSLQFQGDTPRFTFDQLVLEKDVREELLNSVAVLKNRDLLFEEWNLKSIMSPSVLLNLYGSPGTGKTMAAEALASLLGKNIIRASYADIESKYHGEGPKRLKAIFMAAEREDALLFIDEADSLLSARLTNVSQGSEQAINSMRSQLLICLEGYNGIAIFATNLIQNYDKAFLSRLICVELRRPNQKARKAIWNNHLYPVGNDISKQLRIPLSDDIDLDALSEYDFAGREIRNAVKRACIDVVAAGRRIVTQKDLLDACAAQRKNLDRLAQDRKQPPLQTTTGEETDKAADAFVKHIASKGKEE